MGRVCTYKNGYAIYDKTGTRITTEIPTLKEARYINLQFQLADKLKNRKIRSRKRK